MTMRDRALTILRTSGLLDALRAIGEPHLIGSVRMDLMAVRDIDVDTLNTRMSLDRLYALTQFVLQAFRPTWFEAKEEVTDEGKTVWFLGFHAVVEDEMWNFDLWFFDQATIDRAEAFCDGLSQRAHADPALRRAIVGVKQALDARGLYRWDLFHSMDVYSAVLDGGARTVEEFLRIKRLPGEEENKR